MTSETRFNLIDRFYDILFKAHPEIRSFLMHNKNNNSVFMKLSTGSVIELVKFHPPSSREQLAEIVESIKLTEKELGFIDTITKAAEFYFSAVDAVLNEEQEKEIKSEALPIVYRLEIDRPAPINNSVSAVGSLIISDENEEVRKFISRFGSCFERLFPDMEYYVMFDKEHDCICFLLNRNLSRDQIQAYPGVSKKQWLEAWSTDKKLLYNTAYYYDVDAKYEYLYQQVLDILREHYPKLS